MNDFDSEETLPPVVYPHAPRRASGDLRATLVADLTARSTTRLEVAYEVDNDPTRIRLYAETAHQDVALLTLDVFTATQLHSKLAMALAAYRHANGLQNSPQSLSLKP